MRSSWSRCAFSSAAMLLNASTRRRSSSADSHGDPRVEVAAGDAAGRAGQPADRIGDALGHRQPDRRAEQDEEQRREVDAAIELVDLALDFVLAKASGTVTSTSGPAARTGAAASM